MGDEFSTERSAPQDEKERLIEPVGRKPMPGYEEAKLLDLPLAVLDFETSGLDPANDRIVEYGYALFKGGRCTAQGGGFIKSGVPMSKKVQEIHKIADEDLEEAPEFFEALCFLRVLLRNRVPVAYNAPFDRGFLVNEVKRVLTCEYMPFFQDEIEWIDPLVWIRHLYKYERGKKLTDMCPRLGVELSAAHRAMADAKAAGEVLMKLAAQIGNCTYPELISKQQRLAALQEEDYKRWRAKQEQKA